MPRRVSCTRCGRRRVGGRVVEYGGDGKELLCAACEEDDAAEPTEAELLVMIEEQSKPENLPDWWDKHTRAMRLLDGWRE